MIETFPHSISDIARRFSVSHRLIRFYETKGIISPKRTAGNRRLYTEADAVRFGRALQLARYGFTLLEVTRMVDWLNASELHHALCQRAAELKNEASDLQGLRDEIIAEINIWRAAA